MRVLAVAQILHFLEEQGQRSRETLWLGLMSGCQIPRNQRVVARAVREGLCRQARAQLQGGAASVQRREQVCVVRGVDDHRYEGMILRSRAQHGRTADVDILDCLLIGAARPRDRLSERVEVHDKQVDRLDLLLLHHRVVDAAAPEQSAVNFRMERLDAPIHDLGKTGDPGDFLNAHAAFCQQLGGPAGRQNLDRVPREGPSQLEHAGFVGNGQQRAADGQQHFCARRPLPLIRQGQIA